MTIKQALAKAKRELSEQVDDALTNEVFNAVRDVELNHVQKDVYDVYTPKNYTRRLNNGGLIDPENTIIEGGAASNGRLVVANVTPPNPFLNGVNSKMGISTTPPDTNTTKLVEDYILNPWGYGYDYWWDGFERPFIDETKDEIEWTKLHVETLATALKKRGYRVE